MRAAVAEAGLDEHPLVLVDVHPVCGLEVAEVRQALGAGGRLAGLGKDREEDANKQCDDANDDQQLDEGKGPAGAGVR
jgi:hypothetical protein